MKSPYREFTDRIAAQAAAAAPPPADFAWLAGRWRWGGKPIRIDATPYGLSVARSGRPKPFLIYNAPAAMWLLVVSDPAAFGLLIGQSMRDGVARFTGDIHLNGEQIQLRETWRLNPDRSLDILYERRLDGTWEIWDRAVLEPAKPRPERAAPAARPTRTTRPPSPSESR